jgi:ABC-type glycerol-3-phosphate transport system substrate-binding protein
MRNQLKAWLPRIAMLAVLAGAAACGGSDSDGEGPAEPQTTAGGGVTTTIAPTTSDTETTGTVVPPPTELPTSTT